MTEPSKAFESRSRQRAKQTALRKGVGKQPLSESDALYTPCAPSAPPSCTTATRTAPVSWIESQVQHPIKDTPLLRLPYSTPKLWKRGLFHNTLETYNSRAKVHPSTTYTRRRRKNKRRILNRETNVRRETKARVSHQSGSMRGVFRTSHSHLRDVSAYPIKDDRESSKRATGDARILRAQIGPKPYAQKETKKKTKTKKKKAFLHPLFSEFDPLDAKPRQGAQGLMRAAQLEA